MTQTTAELAALLDAASPELRRALGAIADDAWEYGHVTASRAELLTVMRQARHRAERIPVTIGQGTPGYLPISTGDGRLTLHRRTP